MTEPHKDPDYKIEELYDAEELKVCFKIYRMKLNPDLATSRRFDTLEEAEEVVRMMRKYKERIFHYVDEEE
jgi:hypothetical protein